MSQPVNDSRDDLQVLVTTAWRRLPLLVVTGLLLGSAFYYGADHIPPRYSARATLMLEARSSTAAREQQILAIPPDGTSLAYLARSEAAVAGSAPVIQRVLDGLSVTDKAVLAGSQPGAEPDAATLLAVHGRAVTVSNEANTLLIDIDATAPSAELAARLASLQAEAYIAEGVNRKQDEVARILAAINKEVGLIAAAEAEAEAEAKRIRAGGSGLTLDVPDVAVGRLSGLLAEIQSTKQALDERRLELRSAETAGPFERGANLSSVTALQLQLAQVLGQLAAASRFTDSSPDIKRLEGQRDALMQAAREATAGVVENKRAALASSTDRLAMLSAEADTLQVAIRDSDAARVRLEGLRQRVAMLDERHNALVARRAQIEGLRSSITADAILVEPASVPLHPDWPRPKLIAAFGFVFGAALALAVALYLGRRRDSDPEPAHERDVFIPPYHAQRSVHAAFAARSR